MRNLGKNLIRNRRIYAAKDKIILSFPNIIGWVRGCRAIRDSNGFNRLSNSAIEIFIDF